ncbi:hypothetical protein GL263_17830 [Streptomyces durbertensis]|uniref:DUF4232 domain-containing protein n=1 Tax=Streptomyces durbertensis TaxID=2448886 RepID=A0ABR6EJG5_9ACTN|nr:hypothetical protein [Streptomyces durbertensis]MBB1245408.1 hypothetical protein [Streptomyces durbertensis]
MSEGKHDGPHDNQHDPHAGDSTGGPDDAGGSLVRGLDSADEEALRRLLRDAAGEPEPRPDALEHIRRTIPVRRARRRNALIGVGAAALAVGVTLPLMRAGVVPGPLNAHNSANAAQSADAAASGAGAAVDGSAGGERHTGPDGSRGDAKGKDDDPVPHEDAPDHEELAPTAPSCTRDQLGQPVVSVAEPNNNGRIYGHFRLTNVSDETCRIKGGGELTATGGGETPTTGGADGGGGDGGDGGDQTGGDGSGGAGGSGGGKVPDQQEDINGLDTFGTGGGGGGAETAVVLRYTPASGEPRLPAAYLTGACGGTVYRTQPLPTS